MVELNHHFMQTAEVGLELSGSLVHHRGGHRAGVRQETSTPGLAWQYFGLVLAPGPPFTALCTSYAQIPWTGGSYWANN